MAFRVIFKVKELAPQNSLPFPLTEPTAPVPYSVDYTIEGERQSRRVRAADFSFLIYRMGHPLQVLLEDSSEERTSAGSLKSIYLVVQISAHICS